MKIEELHLIRERGEAPLVRTLREIDGYPAGTLGAIVGVDGPYVQVLLAGNGDWVSALMAHEIEHAKEPK